MKEVFLTLLWVIFIADSILLVLIVLLQSGRGGGLSGMLGGAGMGESALGPRSGLPRITGVMAGIFFVAAILIGILTRPRQIMEHKRPKDEKATVERPAAAEPKAKPGSKEAQDKGGAPKADALQPPVGPKPATDMSPAPKPTTDASPAPKAAPAPSTTPGTTP